METKGGGGWCLDPDSNRNISRYWILSPARLPIPPSRHILQCRSQTIADRSSASLALNSWPPTTWAYLIVVWITLWPIQACTVGNGTPLLTSRVAHVWRSTCTIMPGSSRRSSMARRSSHCFRRLLRVSVGCTLWLLRDSMIWATLAVHGTDLAEPFFVTG